MPVVRALLGFDVDVHIVMTGMHMASGDCGPDFPSGAQIHRAGSDLGGTVHSKITDAIAEILRDCGRLLNELKPSGVIVLGDRFDMIPGAMAALTLQVPIIHIHGGEITLGAIDDKIRNAVSLFAHQHCVSTLGARDRLVAMGIQASSIVVTGAPGIDTLLSVPELTRNEFLAEADPDGTLPKDAAFILATVHPETASPTPLAPMQVVLESLDELKIPTLFTGTNSDPGGADMRRMLSDWISSRPWVVYNETLGQRLYANALRLANVMVGNSSSGIIEAGVFGLPVVNVGDRQKGRESGRNVCHVANNASDATRAIQRVFGGSQRTVDVTYGSGNAGIAIAKATISFLRGRPISTDIAVAC